MKENQSSYREIFKATSLFGGVQVFKILISIIRSKIIAVLLGPSGMGIAGLLTSTTGLISALTNFGLGTSAVRNVAEAKESGNKTRIAKVVTIFRRLVWITGILGFVTTLILSSWLSQITFGNKEYTFAFIWLSITLLFTQLTSSQNVLLQGMRKLKYLAKANLFGSFIGLVISIPIYYYWRIDGIVPALIVTSVLTFIIAWFFANKIKIKNIEVTSEEVKFESKNMLSMGIMLSLSSLITIGASFILRIFIRNTGGVEEVGLYTAGFAIVITYVSVVFTAMGTDYYPKLSGVAHDMVKSNLLINQQAEIGILILAPILVVFLIFIDWIVVLLYSQQFIPVKGMIQWAAMGMYFRVVSWCLGYLLLAKAATKVFFWVELISSIYVLTLNLLGYKLFGLDGLGISILLGYILSMFHIYLILHIKYKFSFNPEFYKIFVLQLIIGVTSLIVIKIVPDPWSYFMGLLLIFFSTWYSFHGLEKRIGIKNLVKGYLKK
jgi:O-antigen/teichoic acid export membrane protein